MNEIDSRTVRSLLGLKFFIPNYQRGYRWTEQQVKDLLNDIFEFSNKKSNNSEFYCLQPLVVKKREEDILDKIKNATSVEQVEELLKGTWELIDGQQRLTTLFIILYVLNGVEKYSIEYETRTGFFKFLKNLKPLDVYDNDLVNRLNTEWDNVKGDNDNIDFYHIFIAYHTIKKWFLADTSRGDSIKKGIYDYVRFIWYETTEENQKSDVESNTFLGL